MDVRHQCWRPAATDYFHAVPQERRDLVFGGDTATNRGARRDDQMSMMGWYPDPGGAPGRYRYWDGRTWSEVTVSDPRHPAPSTSPPEGAGSATAPSRRFRGGALVGVLALVVVLVAVGFVIAQGVRSASDTLVDPFPPGPSISGWDDSSPVPTPMPRTSASPLPTPGAPLVPCPDGDPSGRAAHPNDGRVHGGNLSFLEVETFDPATDEERFSFAHDVTQQTLDVNDEPDWIAQLAVGQLRASDGFTKDAHRSAESVAQCLITTDMYEPYDPTRKDLSSGPVRISGKRGWMIESDITVQERGLPFAGDHVVIVVVPDGDDWGIFFGAVPLGDTALAEVLAATVADLRVD